MYMITLSRQKKSISTICFKNIADVQFFDKHDASFTWNERGKWVESTVFAEHTILSFCMNWISAFDRWGLYTNLHSTSPAPSFPTNLLLHSTCMYLLLILNIWIYVIKTNIHYRMTPSWVQDKYSIWKYVLHPHKKHFLYFFQICRQFDLLLSYFKLDHFESFCLAKYM